MTLEELLPDQALRREIEREIHDLAAAGSGVILGRGAAVILHDDERALHVLLDGPVEARVRQAMEIEGVDRQTAERRRSASTASAAPTSRRSTASTCASPASATSCSTRRRSRSTTASSSSPRRRVSRAGR